MLDSLIDILWIFNRYVHIVCTTVIETFDLQRAIEREGWRARQIRWPVVRDSADDRDEQQNERDGGGNTKHG